MASPFSIFRKHQKVWLAVLGILCMFAFVFADMGTWFGGGSGRTNSVVVTTKYGVVKEAELEAMVGSRLRVNEFLRKAMAAAQGFERQDDVFPTDEDSVIVSMVLAKKAEELGVTVSDATVKRFIRDVTNDQVLDLELSKIIQRQGVSEIRLFSELRNELASLEVQRLFGASLSASPPSERWEQYQRMRRRMTVEALPVPVKEFVDKVAEPDEDELRSFFLDHRTDEPIPGSPTPGFKRPHRAKFEYIKAEYDRFYDETLAAVTAEEVQKHYDTYKDVRYLYRKPPAGFSGDDLPSAEAPASNEQGAESSQLSPTGDDSTLPPGGDAAGDSTAEPASSEEPSAGETDPPEPTSDEPTATPESTPETTADASDDPSGCEVTNQPNTSTDAQEPAAETAKIVETESPAADGEGPSDDSDAAPVSTNSQQLSDDYVLPADIMGGADPKYDPLWKVEETIRAELARTRTREKLDALFEPLKTRVDDATSAWLETETADEKGDPPGRPKLDFEDVVRDVKGLTSGETKLISAIEGMLETEIGKSRVNGARPFALFAFEYQPFRAAVSIDDEGNRYLFWKTQNEEARVTEFDETRTEVLAAWKLIQAREPALAAAEGLADKARAKPKDSLKDIFPSRAGEVVTPPAFAWLTFGAVPSGQDFRPRISEIEGIESPGPEFMRAVQRLEPGEVGVALNNPQTTAYVVRLVETNQSNTLMQRTFLADSYQLYSFLADEDRDEITRAWRDALVADAGIHWEREPVEPRTR